MTIVASFVSMKKALLLSLLCFAACHSDTEVSLKPNFYSNNGSEEQVGDITRHDAFATYTFSTDAPSITLRASANLAPAFLPSMGQLATYVDGKLWRIFSLRDQEEEFTLALDSIPAIAHTVAIVESGQICPSDTGSVQFSSLTSISLPQGRSIKPVAKKFTAGLVVWGDSRSVGGGDPQPALQAWPILLRPKFPATEIFTPGWGSLVFSHHIETPAQRAAIIQGIARRLQPYSKQQVWFEVGLNDYYTAACTPAHLQQVYGALLAELHTALPKAKLYVQSDVVAKQEEANKLGYTLQQYRDAELAAAALPYVQAVDGRELGKAEDVSPDKFHLTPEGDARFAERAASILTY